MSCPSPIHASVNLVRRRVSRLRTPDSSRPGDDACCIALVFSLPTRALRLICFLVALNGAGTS